MKTSNLAATFPLWVALAFLTSCKPSHQTGSRDQVEFRISPEIVDFGEVGPNSKSSGKFTVKNLGQTVVTILKATPRCGCTVAEMKSTVLAPNEQTEVTFMVTAQSIGRFDSNIILSTSNGVVRLPFTLLVRPYNNWAVSPESLFLPDSRRGIACEGEIEVAKIGEHNYKITALDTGSEWLKAELLASATSKQVVRVTKSANAPVGLLSTALVVKTDDPAAETITVPLRASSSNGVFVSPNPIIFPAAAIGTQSITSVTVGGWDGDNVPIIKLGDATASSSSVDDKKNATFKISAVPSKVGFSTKTLTILQGGEVLKELPVLIRGIEK